MFEKKKDLYLRDDIFNLKQEIEIAEYYYDTKEISSIEYKMVRKYLTMRIEQIEKEISELSLDDITIF